ncbi:MAG: DUF1499 domain-containing protein [Porticoccaceae bacterium]
MKTATVLLIIALLTGLALLVGGPGARLGLWDFRFGFLLMRYSAYIGMGVLALVTVALLIPNVRQGQGSKLMIALGIAAIVVWIPWQILQQARAVPPIHDITTDTDNPPPFGAIVPLRADAPNPVSYDGADSARQQLAAYPDIQPIVLPTASGIAFDRALASARDLGWEIVAAVPDLGRIEATESSFWYGFEDDVVIRVAGTERESRIDIRSKSRVGKSDLGKNAERIRAFQKNVLERQ